MYLADKSGRTYPRLRRLINYYYIVPSFYLLLITADNPVYSIYTPPFPPSRLILFS
jgi:hypothetical protein